MTVQAPNKTVKRETRSSLRVRRAKDEAAVIAAARNGHTGAFGLLVEYYEPKILLRALRITRNWEDAEDVKQQSFQKAFLHLHSFQGNSSFSTWLIRIAINEALMLLRKKSSWHEVPIEKACEPDGEISVPQTSRCSPLPDESCLEQERKRILYTALKELTPATRTAIQLRELEEHSTQETARILGISVNAAKSRVFQGRRKLREVLNRDPRARSIWKKTARHATNSAKRARSVYRTETYRSKHAEQQGFPRCNNLYAVPVGMPMQASFAEGM